MRRPRLDNGYVLRDNEVIPDAMSMKYFETLFNFFNERLFNNELYMPKFLFKSDRCADAFYLCYEVPYPQAIGFYFSHLLDLPKHYPQNFLHEMVHHWVFISGNDNPSVAHNQAFLDKYASFGITYKLINRKRCEDVIPGSPFEKLQPDLERYFEEHMNMTLDKGNWMMYDTLHNLYKARRKLLKERKARREQNALKLQSS